MARPRPRWALAACPLALLLLRAPSPVFLLPPPWRAPCARHAARPAFDVEGLDLLGDGEHGRTGDAGLPQEPQLSCKEDCLAAIDQCLEEGCPVEASKALDVKLSVDMIKASSSLQEFQAYAEHHPASSASESAERLGGFLERAGALRAQLRASRSKPQGWRGEASSKRFGGHGRSEPYRGSGIVTF